MEDVLAILEEAVVKTVEQGQFGYAVDLGECQYRSENENGVVLRCVIGQLIPNDVYELNAYRIEDMNVYTDMIKYINQDLIKDWSDLKKTILVRELVLLQGLHDDFASKNKPFREFVAKVTTHLRTTASSYLGYYVNIDNVFPNFSKTKSEYFAKEQENGA